ncbi:MAG TPA: DUF1223 domain-containing protein [Caulobacteraceae bacterium]|jgi:hypothetical protein
MLKSATRLALLLLCLASPAAPTLAKDAPSSKARRPVVVVELFTSQGCAACTKANALIADLADRKDVLALTFPVDYWDYLGWKDTFAKPEFSARQRAYMKFAGQREVYTPEVVVDGAPQADRSAVDKAPELIKAALKAAPPEPDMELSPGQIAVGSGSAPKGGADVWLVRYEAQPQEAQVKDGENRGVTVVYRNVAVGLQRLGAWTGRSHLYTLPDGAAGKAGELKLAVLLQARATGKIIGALKP